MPPYKTNEARDWAREKLNGVAHVITPTMTSDFKSLNEKAIRHDVDQSIKHGFIGSLACSELPISMDEYGQFCSVMVDQAKGRLITIYHAAFNSLEENIQGAKIAEAAGAEFALLTYPNYFFPKSSQEVYEYTKAYLDNTNIATMLFPVPSWGFQRLDPSDIPLAMIRKLIDECPNLVAIKAEGGMPYIMSGIQVHRAFHKEVVISIPLEHDYVPLAQIIPIPFCGTNGSAYFGPWLPKVHALIQQGKFDEATEAWFRIDAARKATNGVTQTSQGMINRMIWKYQAWLQGYNGGPMRGPGARVNVNEMATLRRGLEAAGLNPTSDPDEAFYAGRNPA